MGTKVLRHLPLFIDYFGRLTLTPFLSWWLGMFPVKNHDFLTVSPEQRFPAKSYYYSSYFSFFTLNIQHDW